MKTNIVCSDTYIAAFAELDKTTQKSPLTRFAPCKGDLKAIA